MTKSKIAIPAILNCLKYEIVSIEASIAETQLLCWESGEGEIRTRDRLAPILVFKTSALGHYATPPIESVKLQ